VAYRGFGVCREIAQLNALAQKRQTANAVFQDVVQNKRPSPPGKDHAPADVAIAQPAENILQFPASRSRMSQL
jgi:hypothetical protein